ncbi:TRAP transporter small permease [Halobacillus sp. H74]|uniref:TRAP transporter small permease n=1 Tax=Halobacillus sp. H74 TaxID=3457436 RepID=UPI003FCECCE4
MDKLNKILNHFEEYLAVSTLIITSFLVFIQVVLRYSFNYSLVWSEEAARYMIVWFIFIGSSIAVREKAHVAVDAVIVYLPKLWKTIFSVLASLAAMAFCIVLVISGFAIISNVMNFGSVTPSLGIPMYVPYLAIPVGGVLMFIRFTQQLVNHIKNRNEKETLEDVKLEEVSKL